MTRQRAPRGVAPLPRRTKGLKQAAPEQASRRRRRRPSKSADTQLALPVRPQEPIRSMRAIQDTIRVGIWEYSEGIGYNPWQAMIATALAADTPLDKKLECHKEIAQYLLPKLGSIRFEGEIEHEHRHVVDPLHVLFAKWEQEEERERDTLPAWVPADLGPPLEMARGADGEWDLDDDEEEEESGDK